MTYKGLQPQLRTLKDPVLQEIGKYGCYYLSILQMLDATFDSYNDLKEEYLKFRAANIIDSECFINDASSICRAYGRELDVIKSKQLGDPLLTIFCYNAYSGDGYHFIYASGVDTEVERPRVINSYRVFKEVK